MKGSRWLLVDTDYTNLTKEEAAPACGTTTTVRAVLTDRSTIDEPDRRPPIPKQDYAMCGDNLKPGASGRWVVPILVPEHAKLAGIHIADVYARESDTEYRVVSGKAQYIPLDDPVDVGELGDDTINHGFRKGDA